MEDLFRRGAAYIALMVEALAVIFIALGAIEAVRMMLKFPRQGSRKAIWVRFGVWLLLGLEFELGADIIRTAISPTWTQIGQLGAIAVIRTFLNYFLEEDLEKYEITAGRVESAPAEQNAA